MNVKVSLSQGTELTTQGSKQQYIDYYMYQSQKVNAKVRRQDI